MTTKTVTAYKINAEKSRIDIVKIGNLDDMQNVVQGNIETACRIENDDLYVNEEGLYQGYEYGFSFRGVPIMGNGLLIGHDGKGEIADVNLGLLEVASMVRFASVEMVKQDKNEDFGEIVSDFISLLQTISKKGGSK